MRGALVVMDVAVFAGIGLRTDRVRTKRRGGSCDRRDERAGDLGSGGNMVSPVLLSSPQAIILIISCATTDVSAATLPLSAPPPPTKPTPALLGGMGRAEGRGGGGVLVLRRGFERGEGGGEGVMIDYWMYTAFESRVRVLHIGGVISHRLRTAFETGGQFGRRRCT